MSKVRLFFSLEFSSYYPIYTSRRDTDVGSVFIVACDPKHRRCLKRHFAAPQNHPSIPNCFIRLERPPPYFPQPLSGLRTPISPFTCLVGRRAQSIRELWNLTVPEEPIMPGRRVVVRPIWSSLRSSTGADAQLLSSPLYHV